MTGNNQKQPEKDGQDTIDYQWEVLKMSNRMVDVLKLIEQNAVKIRSNSARISRTQAMLKKAREVEGWQWEDPDEIPEDTHAHIDLHAMDYKELEAALKRE